MAQSVKPPTLAYVMISRFVSLSSTLGSVLTAWSLEPALDFVSPPLSALLPLVCSVFLCLSKINKCKKKNLKKHGKDWWKIAASLSELRRTRNISENF